MPPTYEPGSLGEFFQKNPPRISNIKSGQTPAIVPDFVRPPTPNIDPPQLVETGKVTLPPTTKSQTTAASIYDRTAPLAFDVANAVNTAKTTQTFTMPNGAIVNANGQVITPAPQATPDTSGFLSSMSEGIKQLVSAISGRGSSAEKLSEFQEQSGLKTAVSSLNESINRAAGYRQQYTKLDEEEKLALESIYGQGRGIPIGILEGQAGRIQREFAIRKASVAALLGAEAATAESLRGNVTMAQSLAKDALEAYTYDVDTRIDDITSLIGANQSVYQFLSQEKKDAIQQQLDFLKETRTQKQQEFENILKVAGYNLDKQREARLSSGESLGDLSTVDLARLQEAYPDVDFTPLLPEGIKKQIEIARQPKAFTSGEATLLATQAKAAGERYADIIADIDANALIANKDEVKKYVSQVFGKEPIDSDTEGSLSKALDSFFGTNSGLVIQR